MMTQKTMTQATQKTLTVCRASAGTGKTYTLAARYIALLMDEDSNYLYRNILAVTFTNKATAEMKQRILSYLYLIAEGKDGGFLGSVKGYMTKNKTKNDEWFCNKADSVYHNILEDYDNMRVVTIDSFLQTLVSGMAQAVGIGASFNVVLDLKHTISTAVDEIMTTHINEDTSTMNLLANYVEQRLDDEKDWDVRSSLCKMADEIFKESVQSEDQSNILDAKVIEAYRKAVNVNFETEKAKMRALYEVVRDCKEQQEIKSGNRYFQMIERVCKSLDNKASSAQIFKCLSEEDWDKLQDSAFLKRFDNPNGNRARQVQQALIDMHNLCPALREKSFVRQITLERLNDLMLMASVKKRIDVNMDEANSILLARTACVLSKSLKHGDADFILEKAGVRFKHIMIDEFQDTSVLQWNVFKLLAEEVLGSGGTVLVVGDIKQSIYRWRNGDYTIMENLGKSGEVLDNYFTEQLLKRNFRSQANVVEFNLSLFKKLKDINAFDEVSGLYDEGYESGHLDDFHKWGSEHNGYVQCMVFPCRDSKTVVRDIASQMFEDVTNLLDNKQAPSDTASDILILIRNKDQMAPIMEAYNNSSLPSRGVSLCSNDSFKLGKSESVQLIVAALKAIYGSDSISMEFLRAHGKDVEDLKTCDKRMPLYEMTEYIVNILFCGEDNEVKVNDIDYVNCFVDKVRSYVDNYGSDAKGFLKSWDDDLYKSTIPAANNGGIRIMTIHSAKGLEARHVFVPFCSWELTGGKHKTTLWVEPKAETNNPNVTRPKLIPTISKADMAETAYLADYEAEKKAQLVDNLNLLYVALTRAADNLFIYTPLSDKSLGPKATGPATVGDLVFECLKDEKGEQGKTLLDKANEVLNGCYDGKPWSKGKLYFRKAKQTATEEARSPFEYKYGKDEKTELRYFSTRGNISFRQSQESLLYNPRKDNDQRSSRIDAGILRHNILAEIKISKDVDKVIDKFYTKGVIEKKDAEEIKKELNEAWTKWPAMADWFGGGWKLLREVTLICPAGSGADSKTELRPDRVMIKDGKAVVLDFKFGKQNHEKYSRQVKGYVQALQQMGYRDVEGWLWYGFDNELVKVC
jgi:ATP-dependent helicase/nuclease subunit A